jgi:uncharacterized protein
MKFNSINDSVIIERVLSTADICHIALRDGEEIYIVPMYFGYDENNLYMYTEKKSKKVALIEENPSVAFSVSSDALYDFSDKELGEDLECISIQGKGLARILENRDEKCQAIGIIKKHFLPTEKTCKDNDGGIIDSIEVITVAIKKLECRTFGM